MYINKLHKLLIDCNYLVSTDTRKITSNSIFFALKGKNFDGNEYALEALKMGASFVIVDNDFKKQKYENNKRKIFKMKLTIPDFLIPSFRTNHAGETGAVFIYKAILMVSRDSEVIDFSKSHLKTESEHLRIIEEILEKKYRSK